MLQIFHNAIRDQDSPQNSYTIDAIIDPLSNMGLEESELKVFWWTDEMDSPLELLMSVCPQDIENCYTADIPSQPIDTNIKYYIQALDNSGRLEKLPIAGYFDFNLIGSPSLPGDINQDEMVNILDVVIAVNGILGTMELSNLQFQLADMNDDGILNVLDIILIVNEVLN